MDWRTQSDMHCMTNPVQYTVADICSMRVVVLPIRTGQGLSRTADCQQLHPAQPIRFNTWCIARSDRLETPTAKHDGLNLVQFTLWSRAHCKSSKWESSRPFVSARHTINLRENETKSWRLSIRYSECTTMLSSCMQSRMLLPCDRRNNLYNSVVQTDKSTKVE